MPTVAEAEAALTAAIENVYQVFAAYPRKRIASCPCGCIQAGERVTVQRTPLRELAADDLSRYTHKAMTTWGDAADFKHFLPRILELLAADHPMFMIDVSFINKFSHAKVAIWPLHERQALDSYLYAALRLALLCYYDRRGWDFDELLELISEVGADLNPFIALCTAAMNTAEAAQDEAMWDFYEAVLYLQAAQAKREDAV